MFTIQLRYISFIITINHLYIRCGSNPLIGPNVREARPNEFDFVVSLSLKNHNNVLEDEVNHFCGGVLISQRHILTSAHCKSIAKKLDRVAVKIGSNDLRNSQIYEIEDWITFAEYKKSRKIKKKSFLNKDISVIELKEDVNPNIKPAKIAKIDFDKDLVDKTAVTAGWGSATNNKYPRNMLTATLKIISYEDCIRNINEAVEDSEEYELSVGTICTNADPHVVLGCGDSGSPLLINGNEVIGINDSTCPVQGEQYVSLEQNVHLRVDLYAFFINDVLNNTMSYFRSNPQSKKDCNII